MSRNNYKKNTYALIKRGEIYEITKEGNVKKAKNGDNVPFYTKYKISQVLYKMPKKKAAVIHDCCCRFFATKQPISP